MSEDKVIGTIKSNKINDYIIVGSGPAGLTTAWFLSKAGKKCIILEKSEQLGGCHAVKRVNGNFFTEHGPRVYSSSYKCFQNLLKDMNLDFYKLFTPYQFNISNIGDSGFLDVLGAFEILSFMRAYVECFLFRINYKNTSVLEYMEDKLFNDESKDYIDRICRLTDGAGADNYSMSKFLQLINQESVNKLFQPKIPNDKGLIKLWTDKLNNNGVTIQSNVEVLEIYEDIFGFGVKTSNEIVYGKNIIFAIPPYELSKISNIGNIKNMDKNWLYRNTYNNYISISFGWNVDLKLPKVWGLPKSKHGVAFTVMSDYFKEFNKTSEIPESKTLISACFTKDINPEEIENEDDLKNLMLSELRESFPELPEPNMFAIGPKRTAYIQSPHNSQILDFKIADRIYTVGTHNGKSNYAFTSMESAVANSMELVSLIGKETNNSELKKVLKLKQRGIELNSALFLIFIILILLVAMVMAKFSDVSSYIDIIEKSTKL